MLADLSHRVFVTEVADMYQTRVVERFDALAKKDVGNVSRWQKTIRSYVEDGLEDITKEYYVEVDVDSALPDQKTKRGFLNGYSEDDIELLRYDNLTEKDFTGIGSPDIDADELTNTTEIIPREHIEAVRVYRVKMEDFELE
ncbi:hypothetical protein [Halorubrum sp. N11]|uniref:hypothetical protein n=1 Tax=Halorubrum sp. N11 TaxID=3402276 RepID=UPI003EBFA216